MENCSTDVNWLLKGLVIYFGRFNKWLFFYCFMRLIDAHMHLDHERFEKDIDEVVDRARDAGLKVVITSGVNPSSNRTVLELSKKYDIVKCSFGIYPVDAISNQLEDVGEEGYMRHVEKFDVDSELEWIEEHKAECIAIGEVGLDFKIVPGTENLQEPIFRKIIRLAKKLDKPIVIHSRKAELRAIEIMEEEGADKVLMHCFSGKKSLIKRCVDNGWFLSIPAVITRLLHFQMMAEIVPLNNLMTETDAPYLARVAGERSEPADVFGTIGEIAKIKGLDEKEVSEQIFNNAERLFGI